MPEINFNEAYHEAIKTLNPKQLEAVNTIEGPVMVVAGPGTGKTQILAARIGNILQKTQMGPENILCLTFTEAGAVAMRKRLIKFIGPEAYKVDINTFHSFANGIIQDNMHLFAARQLDAITDLEAIDLMKQLINTFDKDHPLKRWTGQEDYEKKPMRNLFQEMKKENWTPEYMHKMIQQELKDFKDDDSNYYKKKSTKLGVSYNKGDFKQWAYDELELKLVKLKAAVDEFDVYQDLMNKNGRYDYADMILWVLDKFSDEAHADMLSYYQEKYQYILVDEYQDTNGSQNDLLLKLLDFWQEPNVFVVGDDDQSIYKFQGANVSNIIDFADRYKNLKVITLENNYRSTQPILEMSKTLIEHNDERLVKKLKGLTKNLIASHPDRMAATVTPELRTYKNTAHQIVHIAEEIEQLHKAGEDLSEVAIIYKKHAQAEDIVRYFELKNIPYTTIRKSNVLASYFISNLITTLRYISEEMKTPHSRQDLLFEMMHYDWYNIDSLELADFSYSLRRKYKTKWRGAIATYGEENSKKPDLFQTNEHPILSFSKKMESWIKASQNSTIQAYIEMIISQSGMLKWILDHPHKVEYMQDLKSFFNYVKTENRKNPNMSLSEFIRLIDLHADNELSIANYKIVTDSNGVTLTTAHGSKGLEWKRVYIIDCIKKIWNGRENNMNRYKLPKALIPGDKDAVLEERRRLFYVAMTRAKEELYLCYPEESYDMKAHTPVEFYTEVRSIIESEGIPESAVDVDDDQMTYFYLNILDELPLPDMEKIDKQLIDRVLESYKLSVTNLNSYLKCPKNFYFSVILGVPAAANANMAFGTAVHNSLENYFRLMTENNSTFPEPEKLLTEFEHHMQLNRSSFTDEQFKNKMEYGHIILPAYHAKYIDSWHKVVTIERNANAVIDGVPIKGKLDKLEFDGFNANVVDYKTGQYSKSLKKKAFNPRKAEEDIDLGKYKDKPNDLHVEKYGGDYWRQAVFYKILIDNDPANNWTVTSAEFDFVEKDQKKDEFVKHKIVLDDEAVNIVKGQIKDAWTRIHNHEFDGECNDEYCRWCGFVRNHYENPGVDPSGDQEMEASALPEEEMH